MKPSKKRMRSCCEGKRSYATLEEAKKAAAAMVGRKKKSGKPVVTYLRAYGCACGKFHYGRTNRINWDLVK